MLKMTLQRGAKDPSLTLHLHASDGQSYKSFKYFNNQFLSELYSIKWENSYNRIHNIWNLSKNGLHYSLN